MVIVEAGAMDGMRGRRLAPDDIQSPGHRRVAPRNDGAVNNVVVIDGHQCGA